MADIPYVPDEDDAYKILKEFSELSEEERAERAKGIRERLGDEKFSMMQHLMRAWSKTCDKNPQLLTEENLIAHVDNDVLMNFLKFTWMKLVMDPDGREVIQDPEGLYFNSMLCGMVVMYESMMELVLEMEEEPRAS